MIIDIIENSHLYVDLNKGFKKAFDFLSRLDLKDLPAGKYQVDGDRVFVIVSNVQGRRKEDALLETHNRYIDIQYILAGTDVIGWKPRLFCNKPAGAYDEASDLRFYADEPDVWVSAACGSFTIFFPEDAHMPLISSGRIHKAVAKVAAT